VDSDLCDGIQLLCGLDDHEHTRRYPEDQREHDRRVGKDELRPMSEIPEKKFELDPAHKFVVDEANKVMILRSGNISVEQRMDAASMMGMHSAWREAQDALIDGAAEIRTLRAMIKDLEKRITDASFILMDWDGYYNPQTKQGNTVELANLIEEAYAALQGKSWRAD
jgi:hypothetical protein